MSYTLYSVNTASMKLLSFNIINDMGLLPKIAFLCQLKIAEIKPEEEAKPGRETCLCSAQRALLLIVICNCNCH